MALRQVRVLGDPILEKRSKEIKEMTPRLQGIIADMVETMYDQNGVGLAAVQVGILKRVVVIDCGMEEPELHVRINPVVTSVSEEEQTGQEGCLSVPGKFGIVTRPMQATVEFLDENMEPQTLTGEGLLARAILHECDHLDGHMFTEMVEGDLMDVSEMAPEDEEEAEEGAETAETEGPAAEE